VAELNIPWEILPVVFIIAFVYSSVGQGGASGFLALFALIGIARSDIAPVALVLNIIGASSGFYNYYRAKHFSYQLLLPFIITSIPSAFIGGMLKVSAVTFATLLGGVLLLAGVRLLFIKTDKEMMWEKYSGKAFFWGIPVGLCIGLISGITGIGGGIFLSPFLLLSGWADAKKAAAVSSAFIILNSISALIAKSFNYNIHWDVILILGLVVAAGGLIGSRLGANKFNPKLLQKLLAIILLLAGFKMFWDVLS
jgi:uncharacterized membrane protein YfcA